MINARDNITKNTLISSKQGLQLVVPGKKVEDHKLIQEKINGVTLAEFAEKKEAKWKKKYLKSFGREDYITSFGRDDYIRAFDETENNDKPLFAFDPDANWIDDPQKALERSCGLFSSLYALEVEGIVHNDLHALNVMVEIKKFPEQEIMGKAEANARKNMSKEKWKSLSSEEKKKLIDLEKEKLSKEEKHYYEYRPIDFGCSEKVEGEKKEEKLSLNMMQIGALMPLLFFGNRGGGEGMEFLPGCHYSDYTGFIHKGLYQKFTEEAEKELENQKNESGYEINIQKKVDEKIHQHTFEIFSKLNKLMEKETRKSYPDRVWQEIALTMADCLSIDPKKRPHADEVLFKFQNLALSNWKKIKKENGEEIYDPENTYRFSDLEWNPSRYEVQK